MESIPRITRAQPMDALSSQATVSGYKAVLLAAGRFAVLSDADDRGEDRAAAKTLVLGAGVAGLQASPPRTGSALWSSGSTSGRSCAAGRVLGAKFLDLGIVGEETEGGYARELTDDERAAAEALEERIPEFDVVITTAAIPVGPRLD